MPSKSVNGVLLRSPPVKVIHTAKADGGSLCARHWTRGWRNNEAL